jgi:sugar lactone lactonase YvrE
MVYWSELSHASSRIRRATIDGMGTEDVIVADYIVGPILLDVAKEKLYWAAGRIYRSELDGSSDDVVFEYTSGAVSLAIDMKNGILFWVSASGEVVAGNLAAGTRQVVVSSILVSPYSVAFDPLTRQIYWTDYSRNTVARMFPDGSNPTEVLTDVVGSSIAIDWRRRMIYWSDFHAEEMRIRRSDLDGSNIEDFVTDSLGYPIGVEVDSKGEFVYWCDWAKERIERVRIDGAGRQTLATQYCNQLALDETKEKIYWTSDWHIGRMNLDGTQQEEFLNVFPVQPFGIVIDTEDRIVYWNEPGTRIARRSLDGGPVEEVVSLPFDAGAKGMTIERSLGAPVVDTGGLLILFGAIVLVGNIILRHAKKAALGNARR